MFFVWSGLGFLVVPIVCGTSLLVMLLLDALLGYLGQGNWTVAAMSIAVLAGAALNWVVGRKLNGSPPRALRDMTTGEDVLLYRRHKLFWIPMQYWSIPVAIVALLPLLSMTSSSDAMPMPGARPAALAALAALAEAPVRR